MSASSGHVGVSLPRSPVTTHNLPTASAALSPPSVTHLPIVLSSGSGSGASRFQQQNFEADPTLLASCQPLPMRPAPSSSGQNVPNAAHTIAKPLHGHMGTGSSEFAHAVKPPPSNQESQTSHLPAVASTSRYQFATPAGENLAFAAAKDNASLGAATFHVSTIQDQAVEADASAFAEAEGHASLGASTLPGSTVGADAGCMPQLATPVSQVSHARCHFMYGVCAPRRV